MRNILRRRVVAIAVAAAAATTLAACASNTSSTGGSDTGSSTSSSSSAALPGTGKPPFVMGDKNFTEEYILGSLYQQALQAKGYTVSLKSDLGSSEIADKALQSGKIDGIPEYTGVIYTELAGLGDKPKSAAETLAGATAYEKKRGFTVLEPTPFQDADGVAVTTAFAQKNNLSTLGDLKKLSSFSFAAPPENATRYQGVVGMHEAYGLNNLKFVPLKIGAQYQALDQGKVDSIAVFTTDPQLNGGKYKVLTDTAGIFGYQNVVPVINTKKLAAEGPAFAATCNAVSKLLTTQAIIAMNSAVALDKKDPAVVAKAFLQANHLL